MSRLIAVSAVLALCAGPAFAATPTVPEITEADWRTPDPQNILIIDTNRGRVLVELIPEVAPLHVARVRALTRKGIYDGRTFFRVIDRFMAQTGDPKDTGEGGASNPNLKAEFTWRRGPDHAFVTVAAPTGLEEGFIGPLPVHSQSADYANVTADQKVSAWGHYCAGVVGMARDADENSANSQFFIMRQAYPSLDKRYTAFGRAISGLDAVRTIKTGEPVPPPQDRMDRVTVLADWPEATRPKVRVIDPKGPWFQANALRVRAEKGADFSLCDIDIPVEIR